MNQLTLRTDPFPSDADMQALMLAVWGPGGEDRQWSQILARSLVHLGAYRGTGLAGFVNVAWDGGIHAFLLDTSVHPNLRRQGVGAALVTEAVLLARQRGAHWLHVDFEPHLAGFYAICGFRPTTAGLIALNGAV